MARPGQGPGAADRGQLERPVQVAGRDDAYEGAAVEHEGAPPGAGLEAGEQVDDRLPPGGQS
jgi:hypothetical protein